MRRDVLGVWSAASVALCVASSWLWASGFPDIHFGTLTISAVGRLPLIHVHNTGAPDYDEDFPVPPALLVSLILPSVWVWKRTRLRTVPDNECADCGYDLGATPGRCPECGTVRGADSYLER